MSKFSQAVVDDLLKHLDGLDVLELIDFHPESIQRSGDEVLSFCPLSQDLSGRYLTVQLKTGRFTSRPPHMPEQTGTLVDLYARCRRISFDEAVDELANEFNVLLLTDTSTDGLSSLLAEAKKFFARAEAEEASRPALLAEAEKRLRHLTDKDHTNVEALETEQRVRLLQGNVVTASTVTNKLLDLAFEKKDGALALRVGRLHLERFPTDLAMRERFGSDLVSLGTHNDDAAAELMALADMAEQSGKPKLAIAAYRQVRDLKIASLDVYPMIITLLHARGKTADAAVEIQHYIEYLRAEGRYREAREQALEKLQLTPDDHAARMQLVDLTANLGLTEDLIDECLGHADVLLEAGAFREAAEALSYLAAELPDHRAIVDMMLTAYRNMGEDDLAGELQYRLIELDRIGGDLPGAMLMLEEILSKTPENPRALKLMLDVMEDSGEVPPTELLRKLLRLEQEKGDFEGALFTAQRLVKAEPTSGDGLNGEALLLLKLGRLEQGVQKLEARVKQLHTSGDKAQTLWLLETAFRLRDAMPVRVLLAAEYQRQGDSTKATNLLSSIKSAAADSEQEASTLKLLEANPKDPQLLAMMAELHLRAGKKDKAREFMLRQLEVVGASGKKAEIGLCLEAIIKTEPSNPELLGRLETAAAKSGFEEQAVELGLRLAESYRENGKAALCVETARRVLQLRAENRKAYRELIKGLDHLSKTAEALQARLELARILSALPSHLEEEASILREILKAEPGNVSALSRLVEVLLAKGSEQELAGRIDQLLEALKGDRDRSIKIVRELLRKRSSLALHQRLARLYREAGRVEEMVAEMQMLIETCEGAGQNDEAVTLYEELLQQAPDSISSRAGLIILLRKIGKTEKAIEHYFSLARSLMAAGKPQDAVQAFEELVELAPENPEVFRGHAAALRALGMDNEANGKLRDLASLYGRQGKLERAISVLHELMEDGRGSVETRREIIRLRRESGQLDQAVEELAQIAEQLARDKDVEGAIAARREAATMMPKSSEVRLLLIRQLEQAGRVNEAAQESLSLVEAHLQEKRFDKAVALLDPMIRDNAGNLPARRLRARAYDLMGDERRALAEYREMQTIADQSPAAIPATGGFGSRQSPDPDDNYPQLALMAEYGFDSFIVGSKNSFAFATAKAVAEHPGSARNPLFLYSEAGLGKTHLLHAIGNYLKAKRPEFRILYTSTEFFTSELIDAIQNNRIAAFRNKHLMADVLLLDDVQFLAGKERSQEEFFHVFNMLFQKQRQIVVTSDRPPKDIAHLNMRLRSRFGQGVIVDIQSPDVETRMAILKAEGEKRGFKVPTDVVSMLAERVTTNIRELKGAFNQLLTMHEIGQQPLNVALAQQIVERYFG
jgi:chromosomal replication initiator protein DnaA